MADEIRITIQDNSGEAMAEMKVTILRALEKCGLFAEEFVKKPCPVNTGILRNCITHHTQTKKRWNQSAHSAFK